MLNDDTDGVLSASIEEMRRLAAVNAPGFALGLTHGQNRRRLAKYGTDHDGLEPTYG